MSKEGVAVVSTTDIAIAGFFYASGLELDNLKREKGGRHNGKAAFARFYFKDPEDRAHALTVAFANSEAKKFDEAVRTLKKIVQSVRKERRGAH